MHRQSSNNNIDFAVYSVTVASPPGWSTFAAYCPPKLPKVKLAEIGWRDSLVQTLTRWAVVADSEVRANTPANVGQTIGAILGSTSNRGG